MIPFFRSPKISFRSDILIGLLLVLFSAFAVPYGQSLTHGDAVEYTRLKKGQPANPHGCYIDFQNLSCVATESGSYCDKNTDDFGGLRIKKIFQPAKKLVNIVALNDKIHVLRLQICCLLLHDRSENLCSCFTSRLYKAGSRSFISSILSIRISDTDGLNHGNSFESR